MGMAYILVHTAPATTKAQNMNLLTGNAKSTTPHRKRRERIRSQRVVWNFSGAIICDFSRSILMCSSHPTPANDFVIR